MSHKPIKTFSLLNEFQIIKYNKINPHKSILLAPNKSLISIPSQSQNTPAIKLIIEQNIFLIKSKKNVFSKQLEVAIVEFIKLIKILILIHKFF